MDETCFECGAPAVQHHHVVPRLLGGTRTIPLCREHHQLAHGANVIAGVLIAEGRRRARLRAEETGEYPAGLRITKEIRAEIIRLRRDGLTVREIGAELGISYSSIQKLLVSVNMPGAAPPVNQRPLFGDASP